MTTSSLVLFSSFPRSSGGVNTHPRTVKKLRFQIYHASRIHASEKLEGPSANCTSITHPRNNTTNDTTSHLNIGDAGLAAVTPAAVVAASQRDTHSSTPVSSTCPHPMAAVRDIDGLLTTAALAVALAGLAEVQRRDALEDEMEENTPRVKLTRGSRKKRDMSMYASLGAAAGRRRPL